MAKHASQENKLALMSSHIEFLLVHIRADIADALRNEPAASQRALDTAIPTLLPLLPKLTRCVFDGALYRETLSQLVQTWSLKYLVSRGHD